MTELSKKIDEAILETGKIIVGKDEQIRLIFGSILCGGHVLLDDLPGTGKTTLVKTISKVLGCNASRVQFTPDLLPSDILGMNIFDQKTSDFKMMHGPIMTNIFLADEINRAIPRTQSALLEAMEELQVTIDGTTYPLPKPFVVMATQNPVEMESTFKLPIAQMDRFMMRLSLGYPTYNEEIDMLKTVGDGIPFDKINEIISNQEIVNAQEDIAKVHIDDRVTEYIVSIADATRDNDMLTLSCSPRGSRALYRASKVWAAISGRDYVIPDDVKYLAPHIVSHRIVASKEATMNGLSSKDVVTDILAKVDFPVSDEELIGAK